MNRKHRRAAGRDHRRTQTDPAEAQVDLGNTLLSQGRLDEAVAAYRAAIGIRPDYVEVRLNLGVALRRQGQLDEAAAAYREAIAIRPDYAEAYSNLGNVLITQERIEAAADAYRQAVAIRPGYAEAHANLGGALLTLGKVDDAVAACRRAVALKPDHAEAHGNLGNALSSLGRLREAVAAYRRAIALDPGYAAAHLNLGNALRRLGQLSEAEAAYRQAIALRPDYADAHSNLGNALQDQGRLDEAMSAFRRAMSIDPAYAAAHSNLLMCMNYAASTTNADLHAEALRFGQRYAAPATHFPLPNPARRLRVGYVSGDFRAHPIGYFLARVLPAHDRGAVEVCCYADHAIDDAVTARLRAGADRWQSILGLSDADAAELIRRDGIDILIDLAGHSAGNRLAMFALRPAPVQASWIGYFASTGLGTMDAVLADRFVVPAGEERFFTETVCRLPGCYLCYAPHDIDVQPAPPPALVNNFVTFGCFNNRAKITADTVRLWAEVLQAVDGARLFLKSASLADAGVAKALTAEFLAHGVPAERLILEGHSPLAEMLAAYRRIDIALDPIPFGGGTTTAEALWMGVPVVTLRGDRWVGRMSESILTAVGLPELVADDRADYVRKAAVLAADELRLDRLHRELRGMVEASPFCDGPAFVRSLEAAYRGMRDNLGR